MSWSIHYKIGRSFELILKEDGTVLRNRREEGERNAFLGTLPGSKVNEVKQVLDSVNLISSTRYGIGSRFMTDQETIAYRNGTQEVAWPFARGSPPEAIKSLHEVILNTFSPWLS